MSAPAKRNSQPSANDSEWVDFPDRLDISPASVWAADYTDYEEEITLQSKRVAANPVEQATAGAGDEPNVEEASPRALTLDESRVLPGEASFATVELYQQFDATAASRHEHLTTRAIEESRVNRANSGTRRLDVSHVLPGEVSYATVMLQTGARTYSPLREFFSKSSWDWRKLTVEALLLVSISSAIAIGALKIVRPSVFSWHRPESSSANIFQPQAEPAPTQAELPTSQAVVSEAVSRPETEVKDENPTASIPQTEVKPDATVEAQDKSNVASNPEGSRRAPSDEIKLKPRKTPQPEAQSATGKSVSPVESSKREMTNQQPRASVKESEGSHRTAPSVTVGANNSRTVGARQEASSLSTNALAARPTVAPTTTPVTGGGQRPRTVKPKVNP